MGCRLKKPPALDTCKFGFTVIFLPALSLSISSVELQTTSSPNNVICILFSNQGTLSIMQTSFHELFEKTAKKEETRKC